MTRIVAVGGTAITITLHWPTCMQTHRPHEIVRLPEGYRTAGGKWLPLSEAEAAMLQPLSEDQRAEWFAKLPRGERRRRQRAHDKASRRRP